MGPSLPPGVVARRTTWEEVKAAVADGSEQALGTLGRLQEDIEHYNCFRQKVKGSHFFALYRRAPHAPLGRRAAGKLQLRSADVDGLVLWPGPVGAGRL